MQEDFQAGIFLLKSCDYRFKTYNFIPNDNIISVAGLFQDNQDMKDDITKLLIVKFFLGKAVQL
jgi:hypothetical protein